jgi:hypothetical protein
MKSTLVVGGEASFVASKLTSALAQHGLRVDANWPWDKEKGAFPDATEVVFILTDMAGHHLNDAAQAVAQQRSLPIIYGVRKWALNVARLEKMGFPILPSTMPSPEPAPAPEPTETETMPAITYDYDSDYHEMGEKRKKDYQEVLRELAKNPAMSNRGLEDPTNIPRGTVTGLAESARKTLGIANGYNNKYVTLDRPRYAWWCEKLGVTPVENDALPKVTVPGEKKIVRKTRPATVPPPIYRKPEPVPAPVATPVSVPVPETPRDENADLKDLVGLIRLEMVRRNITKMVVTPENVEVTRLVVTTETLGY